MTGFGFVPNRDGNFPQSYNVMQLKFSFADSSVSRCHNTDFMSEFFNSLRECAGYICQSSGFCKRFYFACYKEDIKRFRHTSLCLWRELSYTMIRYKNFAEFTTFLRKSVIDK